MLTSNVEQKEEDIERAGVRGGKEN